MSVFSSVSVQDFWIEIYDRYRYVMTQIPISLVHSSKYERQVNTSYNNGSQENSTKNSSLAKNGQICNQKNKNKLLKTLLEKEEKLSRNCQPLI